MILEWRTEAMLCRSLGRAALFSLGTERLEVVPENGMKLLSR